MLVGLRRVLFVLCLSLSPGLVLATGITYYFPFQNPAPGGQTFANVFPLNLSGDGINPSDIFNINSQAYRYFGNANAIVAGIGMVHVVSYQPTLNLSNANVPG